MVLEVSYGVFGDTLLVYVWGYDLVSDITFFLNDTLVFGTDLVINNV